MAGYIGKDSSGVLLAETDPNAVPKTGGSFTGAITVDETSASPLTLDRNSTDGSIVTLQKDGTTVGSIGSHGSTKLYIGSGAAGLRFTDGSTDLINPYNTSTNADVDGTVNLGYDGGRFKDLYLSGGVYLGGTTTANKLDDYEEGTWTPVIGGGTGATIYGHYTKVGNLVTVTLHMENQTLSGASGVQITGLPFTNGGRRSTTGDICYYNLYGYDNVVGLIEANNTNIQTLSMRANLSWVGASPSNGSTRYLHLHATYLTN